MLSESLGKVVMMHVRDGLVDPQTYRINVDLYRPVGRMYGRLFTRASDTFEMVIPTLEEWERDKKEK